MEDVSLELKGTLSIIRNDIPEIEVVGTAQTEKEFWKLMEEGAQPDLILLDLGLGGSTTVGVDICRKVHSDHPEIKVLIFTGELLNEKLWVDVLEAGAHGMGASGLRYSGWNTMVPWSELTSPLWRGIPNLVWNPVLMYAMGFILADSQTKVQKKRLILSLWFTANI